MTNAVTIKQIKEVKNPKSLIVATADVNIGSITHKGFKIVSTEQNTRCPLVGVDIQRVTENYV